MTGWIIALLVVGGLIGVGILASIGLAVWIIILAVLDVRDRVRDGWRS